MVTCTPAFPHACPAPDPVLCTVEASSVLIHLPQVLTALELARQARIAANRAYLAGLGLGPQAMHTGQVGGWLGWMMWAGG